MSDEASTFVGRTLDERYRIDRLLGEGGMGAVFVAHHLRLDKPVALKVILAQHAGNAELAARFAREAMLTAKIDHPHVVSAIDTGALPDGGAYLVMQLAKGRSLRELVQAGAGWPLACEIGAQIADALAAAHAIGVVHRDLKPENVIVEERDGQVHARVLDFGIARADAGAPAGAAGSHLTRAGTVLGTPGYMPPEQALGEAVDGRADLYALGVIVWELAAGRMLFQADDPGAITLAQLSEPVPALPQADAPPALVELLDALLSPKKDARPSSASEVRERLRQLRALAAVSSLPPAPAAPRVSDPALADTGRAPGPAAALAAPSVASPPVPLTRVGPANGGAARPPWRALSLGLAGALVLLLVCGGLVLLDPLGCGGGELADVPRGAREDAATLLHATDPMTRWRAASALATERDALPPALQHLVDLELAQTCEERRDAVRALATDADPRALPSIQRLQAIPREGCGRDGEDDCHACMREDLDAAAQALGGTPAPAPTPGSRATPTTDHPSPPPSKAPPQHGHGHGHGHGH